MEVIFRAADARQNMLVVLAEQTAQALVLRACLIHSVQFIFLLLCLFLKDRDCSFMLK